MRSTRCRLPPDTNRQLLQKAYFHSTIPWEKQMHFSFVFCPRSSPVITDNNKQIMPYLAIPFWYHKIYNKVITKGNLAMSFTNAKS